MKDSEKKLIPFILTPELESMARRIRQHNQMTREVGVILPDDFNMGVMEDVFSPLYRVFSNGRFDRCGRFYGGTYQLLPKYQRKHLLLGGAPVSEVDYGGFQTRLLYHHYLGVEYQEKPYLIDALYQAARYHLSPTR